MTKRKFFIGTSGFVYPHWKGKFYPKDLSQNKWFEYYCAKFPTVEIDATYYRSFGKKIYQNWYSESPKDFKYVLKAHRIIVHRKKLTGTEIKRCWESAITLKEKLGLILLQFSQKALVDKNQLEKIFSLFPDPRFLAAEFRNHNWLQPEIKKLLQIYKVTFCSSDAPEINLTNWITSDIGYIRLHGYSKNNWYAKKYQKKDLTQIATIANQMLHKGAKQVFIFFNNDVEGFAPQNALELINII